MNDFSVRNIYFILKQKTILFEQKIKQNRNTKKERKKIGKNEKKK